MTKHVRLNTYQKARSGVSAVESAIVLPVLLLMLLFMLDLALAAFRYNALGEAVRLAARTAIVHGAESPQPGSSWGPATMAGHVADGSSVADALSHHLPTMTAANVTYRVSWPDGENRPGSRVRAEATYAHQPILGALIPYGPITLNATCTMRVVN